MTEADRFHRYYFPREPYSPEAIAINHLTREAITRYRTGCQYPACFNEDADFDVFCSDVTHYIAHNADFERKFIPILRSKKAFCTMKSNVDILKLEFLKSRNYYKYPSLKEAARHYQVPYDDGKFHDSLYDTEITVSVFKRMLLLANGA
jgi:DNA polymerase III epsilon subunit-like protein